TVHLPDLVVPVFTANQQSLEGVSRVLRQARDQRSKLPLNRAALLILPVPSRFDARGQDELAKIWLNKFAQRLEPVYENWLDLDVPARQILDFTKIPYFSSWTFGERLAVLEERETDPERISYHFATIAALIARRLASSDELVRNRDGYVEAAKSAGKAKPTQEEQSSNRFAHDFYVSYAKSDDAVANEVVSLLRSVGARVFTEGDVKVGADIRQSLYDAVVSSQHLLLLGHGQLSRWQRSEAEQFFEASQADAERKLVLLDLDGSSGTGLDGALEAMKAVRLNARAAPLGEVLSQLFTADAATALRQGRKLTIDPEILELADRYLAVRIESYVERVKEKDRLVAELGKLILVRQVSRDILVSSKHAGLIAGLAEAVQRRPENGDIQRLVDAGLHLTRLHAAFRLLTAILTIWDTPGVGQVVPTSFNALLDGFTSLSEKASDRPLRTLVETARRRLEHYS
ncbi:MAG TPA: TIR domain-containing protein, partial [Polyangiaceae bacterium]|nr:TIR domain-containing protein [Polyangiaceae bacterium]